MSEKNLAHQQPLDLVKQPITPMEMISSAMSNGATVEQLEKLIEFAERMQANDARMSFNQAMADFKKSPPSISKNKHVKFGQTEYVHATLDHVTEVVTDALSKVGISHKWTVNQDAGGISVSCVLTHEKGHSEITTLTAGADTSGSKNAIQAIGSTVTYLQRYTLLAATGLAASGDGDGLAADDSPRVAEEKLVGWLDSIDGFEDVESLTAFFKKVYKEAFDFGDIKACQQLVKRKDAQKAAINEAA